LEFLAQIELLTEKLMLFELISIMKPVRYLGLGKYVFGIFVEHVEIELDRLKKLLYYQLVYDFIMISNYLM